MNHPKSLRALLPIAIVLILCAARAGTGAEPSGHPSVTAAAEQHSADEHAVTVDKPYSYSGTFNYVAPAISTAPEDRWKVAAEIATVFAAILFAIGAMLIWSLGRKQKKTAEAAETLARQSVELVHLGSSLIREFGARQRETTEAARTIARQTTQLTALVAGLVENLGRRGNETAVATEEIARQNAQLTTLVAESIEEFSRRQNEIAETAHATALKSVELTTRVLDVERPHFFVEEPEIEMSLPAPTALSARAMSENIALEPLRYAVTGAASVANVTIGFMLRNRGKGIGTIRRIRVRMLIGRGACENGDAKLRTLSTVEANVRNQVIGAGERAQCFCFGLQLPLHTLDEVRQFNRSLRFVVVVSHSDRYRRPLATTFPFEYRPPARSPHFTGSPDYPAMLLPVLKDRRAVVRAIT